MSSDFCECFFQKLQKGNARNSRFVDLPYNFEKPPSSAKFRPIFRRLLWDFWRNTYKHPCSCISLGTQIIEVTSQELQSLPTTSEPDQVLIADNNVIGTFLYDKPPKLVIWIWDFSNHFNFSNVRDPNLCDLHSDFTQLKTYYARLFKCLNCFLLFTHISTRLNFMNWLWIFCTNSLSYLMVANHWRANKSDFEKVIDSKVY